MAQTQPVPLCPTMHLFQNISPENLKQFFKDLGFPDHVISDPFFTPENAGTWGFLYEVYERYIRRAVGTSGSNMDEPSTSKVLEDNARKPSFFNSTPLAQFELVKRLRKWQDEEGYDITGEPSTSDADRTQKKHKITHSGLPEPIVTTPTRTGPITRSLSAASTPDTPTRTGPMTRSITRSISAASTPTSGTTSNMTSLGSIKGKGKQISPSSRSSTPDSLPDLVEVPVDEEGRPLEMVIARRAPVSVHEVAKAILDRIVGLEASTQTLGQQLDAWSAAGPAVHQTFNIQALCEPAGPSLSARMKKRNRSNDEPPSVLMKIFPTDKVYVDLTTPKKTNTNNVIDLTRSP